MRTRSMFCMVVLFVMSFGMLLCAQEPARPNRPAGVPEGYVSTPYGYFHPSCVLQLAEGETLRDDGRIIQRADGTLENLPACEYPHYTLNGELVAAGATKVESPGADRWVEFSNVATSSSYIVPAASTYIITTVAGTGTGGYSGDGGLAIDAEIWSPTDVALDTAGNVYIADFYNCRIRKITISTGDISTVAGNGTCSYSGDGGAATKAEMQYPYGVAVDSSSNIYIADAYNCRIRKVTASTGIISTVAGDGTCGYSGNGGAATSAELYWPKGVAIDASGNIYIADSENNVMRKVTISTGKITTVAGTGVGGYSGDGGPATSAELYQPIGVALDSSSNIYIADVYNQRIRKVIVSTGIITTVAGDGTEGYSGDGGPATSAALNYPQGVALDGSGNMYIADTDNCRMREVSNGTIITIAGNGTCGYLGDGGPAADAELYYPVGVVPSSPSVSYIADTYNNRVRKVAPGD